MLDEYMNYVLCSIKIYPIVCSSISKVVFINECHNIHIVYQVIDVNSIKYSYFIY